MVPQPRLPVKVMQQLPLTEVHLQMVMQQLLLTEQQMELQLPTEAHLQTEVQHLTEHLQTEAVTSDGSSNGTASTDSSSSGAIVNGGFTDEQLGNTDETRTIYRNSDGKPRVIVPDGNGAWMDNEGNRFTFSSQYDCDVYEEDGTSFYWHGEAADVYYMPVQ